MRNYLLGVATAGLIAVQFMDLNSAAYFITVWATIAAGITGLALKIASK